MNQCELCQQNTGQNWTGASLAPQCTSQKVTNQHLNLLNPDIQKVVLLSMIICLHDYQNMPLICLVSRYLLLK